VERRIDAIDDLRYKRKDRSESKSQRASYIDRVPVKERGDVRRVNNSRQADKKGRRGVQVPPEAKGGRLPKGENSSNEAGSYVSKTGSRGGEGYRIQVC